MASVVAAWREFAGPAGQHTVHGVCPGRTPAEAHDNVDAPLIWTSWHWHVFFDGGRRMI